jgi:hypothetical protein
MPLKNPFRLLIGFINNLQVVSALTYYTIARLHNLESLLTNLLTLSALVFTYSVSLNQTFQVQPSVHTQSLHAMNFPWLSLKILKQSQIHRRILLRKFTPGTVQEFPGSPQMPSSKPLGTDRIEKSQPLYCCLIPAVTCLSSRCLGMGSVTLLFYCCVT